jgi:hypothetical protein
LLTVDEEPLNWTSWLIVGLVGETVKRAIVGPVLGKSVASNATVVGLAVVSVTAFSDDSAPVFVSFAESVTLASGVGAVPLLNVFELLCVSSTLKLLDCPDATVPIALPLASAWSVFAV